MSPREAGGDHASAAPSSPDERWIPIDDLLATARSEMRSGQMVHPDNFDLFHSMNALQILDPKMDVGMAPPPGEPPLRTSTQLIADGRAPLDLSDDDAVYVFDALLACEATWHHGQSIATTVYTSLYLHDLDRLEAASSPVVRAYFRAVRCACATVRHAVSVGDIYEEEDFVMHLAGHDIGPAAADVDPSAPDPALAGLRAAEAWLVDNPGTEDKTGGLLARVRFRIALHVAMKRLFAIASPAEGGGEDVASEAREWLDRAAAHLDKMRATAVAPPDVPSGVEALDDDELDWDPDGLGFDRRVNLTKMGPAPPRTVKLYSRRAAFDRFAGLVAELRRVCDLAGLYRGGTGALHEVVAAFASMSERDPGVVSRSFAAVATLTENGGLLGKHFGDAALRSAWVSGTAPPPVVDLGERDDDACGAGVRTAADSDADDATDLAFFLARSARPAELLVRAYLSNRSRLRRKLRRLLTEWTQLADLGREVDAAGGAIAPLRALGDANPAASVILAESPWASRAFGGWADAVVSRAQLAHLTLGFNLELYLPHELCMVYWYCEYLMQDLQETLRVAEASLTQEAAAARGRDAGKGKGRGRGKGKGASGASSAERDGDGGASLVRIKMEIFVLELQKTMCKGLVRLTAGLEAAGRLRQPPPNDFTDGEQNFWQRFGVFHACQRPQPLHHADFAAYTKLDDVTPDRLFTMAGECFASARALAKQLLDLPPGIMSSEQTEDIAATDKTAAANAAAAKLVAVPGVAVDFEHKHHPVFAAVVVKRERK